MSAASAVQAAELPAAVGPYCLVVDDEPRLRQALMRLMRSDGFTCFEAGSGVGKSIC